MALALHGDALLCSIAGRRDTVTARALGRRRMRRVYLTAGCVVLMALLVVRQPEASAVADPCGSGFPEPDVQSTVTHSGDLVLTGSDQLVIENQKFVVDGNVYLSGDAQLVLRNAELLVDHYPRQEIFVSDRATLSADNAVFTGFLHTSFSGESNLIADRVFLINLIGVSDRANVSIENSCIFEDRFGLVQVGGQADVHIVDSVVGALGLEIPPELPVEIDGLVSGFFEYWDAREALSGDLGYDLTLDRTTVMENPGYSGGYELGWNVFTTSDADLSIRDSILNKLVVAFDGSDVHLTGLDRSTPVSGAVGNVQMVDTEIRGQWGIFVADGDLLVEDSDGVWLWPEGDGDTTVVRTAVNEFDPRHYTGTIRLEHSSMTNGFEVFDGSVFRMEGTVDMRDIGPLFSSDSFMTRGYEIVVIEAATGLPVPGVGLELAFGGSVVWSGTTTSEGTAGFDLTFGRDNYESTWRLRSTDPDVHLDREVSIYADSPVQVNLVPDPSGNGVVPAAAVDCSSTGTGSGTVDAPYPTIGDALDAVGGGGIVTVGPGTCQEIVELSEGVTVAGAGPVNTVIDGNVFAREITGAALSNVTVTDDDTAGVHCYDSQLTISNSVIRDQPHNGIHASACDLTVVNNTFVSNGGSGINLLPGSTAVIENNVFASNGEFGLAGDGAAAMVAYNDFWANGIGPYEETFVPSGGNIYVEPRFVSDMDLRYLGDSPCIHAGDPDPAFDNPDGTRNTLGAYGGPNAVVDPVADYDADGVLDPYDWCPGTVLPDAAPLLKPNRYRVSESGEFISDAPNAPTYSTIDTAGCSASQIVDELGLGRGQELFGLSRSALERWIDLVKRSPR
jgi:hypothetical protein